MDKITIEIYQSAYAFHKQYVNISQSDDEEWEKAIAEADSIIKKYDGNVFCRHLINEVMNDIERRSKQE
jgi:hypothetical protein